MRVPRLRFTIRFLMIAMAVVAVFLVMLPPEWRLLIMPGRHRHKLIAQYRGEYVSPSGQIFRGGIVTVFDDGCIFGD
jgi:hypothetical protein